MISIVRFGHKCRLSNTLWLKCCLIDRQVSNCCITGGITNQPKSTLYCEYCGAKKLLVENENVVIERIRNEANKEKTRSTSSQEKLQKYRQGVFMRLTIVFAVLSAGGCFVAFRDGRILAGIVAAVQIVLFSLSLLIGNRIIKIRFLWIYVALGIIGLALVSLFLSLYNGRLYQIM